MRIKTFFTVIILFCCKTFLCANDITGYWQTIDKKTKQPSSVIAIYPYQGKYYGRIVATYNKQGVIEETMQSPHSRAPGMVGNPYYCGLDIVWVESDGSGRYKGYVVDPQNGKLYNAKVWKEKGNLILRGEVLMFGRNEVWPPFSEQHFNAHFNKPDLSTFVPVLHKLKG